MTEPTFFFISIAISISFCFIIQTHVLASSNSNNNPFPKEAHPTKTGYLPVSTTSSSAMFYYFYEAQNSTLPLSQTPLLIWLQGGPGTSSMLGNLYEVGPWTFSEKSFTFRPNSGAWNRLFGLLFLDNPIGTGFSVAASQNEIPTDQNGVAKHLFAAITTFLKLHPEFKHRPIYISGESYGGKYIVSIGYYILKENEGLSDSGRVNLVGVTIGNGATDPETQTLTHAITAYHAGLINDKQKEELEKIQMEAVTLAQNLKWSEAADAQTKALTNLQEMTGLATCYDYTRKDHPYHYKDWMTELLNMAEVKKTLGVNESLVWVYHNSDVRAAMYADLMKSVKFKVEELLRSNSIRVLLYQGQWDLLDGPVQVEAWVKTMEWEGIVEYLNAERKIWKVNGEFAGYVQQWKSLTNVVVLGGGHFLPADQPINAQAMIEDWIFQRGIFGNSSSFGFM
ncbi:hypothetical protein PIB30_034644 [Stylosanthes scabra]|uniref:Carboxypeptidase n=1 Tax=Stylosanthes scabra TaxID=79078 RepID=A0ABU6YBQ9_9FABA|nr:hypothetical protein [Stylosanthes scabra]